METLNTIFEKYGGERLVRVFKTYWILSLLIKQLIFSFFMVPADQHAVNTVAEEITWTTGEEKTRDAVLPEKTESFEFFRLMATLALIGEE